MAPRILRLANPTSYAKIRTSLSVITTKGYAGFRDESPSRSMRKRLGFSYENASESRFGMDFFKANKLELDAF